MNVAGPIGLGGVFPAYPARYSSSFEVSVYASR
jgi:hypothetical protein